MLENKSALPMSQITTTAAAAGKNGECQPLSPSKGGGTGGGNKLIHPEVQQPNKTKGGNAVSPSRSIRFTPATKQGKISIWNCERFGRSYNDRNHGVCTHHCTHRRAAAPLQAWLAKRTRANLKIHQISKWQNLHIYNAIILVEKNQDESESPKASLLAAEHHGNGSVVGSNVNLSLHPSPQHANSLVVNDQGSNLHNYNHAPNSKPSNVAITALRIYLWCMGYWGVQLLNYSCIFISSDRDR